MQETGQKAVMLSFRLPGRGAGRFQGVVRRASHDRPGSSEGQRCPSPDH